MKSLVVKLPENNSVIISYELSNLYFFNSVYSRDYLIIVNHVRIADGVLEWLEVKSKFEM